MKHLKNTTTGGFERMLAAALAAAVSVCSCAPKNQFEMGTYGYDSAFLAGSNVETIELSSSDGQSKVLLAPGLQGRVMTSTTGGDDGRSYGWINHDYIKAGEVSPQFNPYGGEERFWIGPEGGPFSWYFAPGAEQIYANWLVPKAIDTEGFDVAEHDSGHAVFTRKMHLSNASGHVFDIGVRRTVSLVDGSELADILGTELPSGVRLLAYRTDNVLTNEGGSEWTRETGMPSVWLLGMFSPTPTTTVFIPYEKGFGGRIVNDEYFGKIPSDRLTVDDGVIYFRIDGKFRAKLGLPSGSAKDVCGSYDSAQHVLNILKYTVPDSDAPYVNGQWGPQEDPFCGDVINSYNDGPTETGTVMGPFYEIETSSPAAALAPGESLTHTQYTIHIEGDESDLAGIVAKVFGVELEKVANMFR